MGVFTGSSALASALASEKNAKVIAIDKSRKYVDIARKYWKQAEIQDKIDLRLGDANVVLENLLHDHKEFVDFTYIDADKANYVEYFKKCLILSRKGGIIAIDNTLFRGQVIHQKFAICRSYICTIDIFSGTSQSSSYHSCYQV